MVRSKKVFHRKKGKYVFSIKVYTGHRLSIQTEEGLIALALVFSHPAFAWGSLPGLLI